jgi:hypothetical protein
MVFCGFTPYSAYACDDPSGLATFLFLHFFLLHFFLSFSSFSPYSYIYILYELSSFLIAILDIFKQIINQYLLA